MLDLFVFRVCVRVRWGGGGGGDDDVWYRDMGWFDVVDRVGCYVLWYVEYE